MERLIVCGATRDQVMQLCKTVGEFVKRHGCLTGVTWTVPPVAVRANLGVDRFPAILFVRNWPDDLDLIWQGEDPPKQVLSRSVTLLVQAEAPLRVEMDKAKQAAEESRRLAPRTLEDAVGRILAKMSDKDRETVRSTPEEDLILFHHGWGMGIRNAWLHGGNHDLIADCGAFDVDEASMKIIHAVWERLNDK